MKNITAKEAQTFINNGEVVVVDVRTPEEFAEGHIAGAKNIDIQGEKFEEKIKKLDPNATYLVNCKLGGRSSRAVAHMNEIGFKDVTNLEGGITAWKDAGLSTEKK
ncbi:MAG: rhodanese-like domain-containing protein [bacterium]|nr:rhodanese-like domain-containing protein [bacterium]